MHFLRHILPLLALVLTLPCLRAQENASGSIGSRDSVEVRVFCEDDLTTRGQLSDSGSISIPLIGSVKLAGLSTDAAARLIEEKLRDGYLVRPEVTVSITQRVRKTITVHGQAQRPGMFMLDPNRPLTLAEAIGMAGGMTRIANPRKVTLKRRGQDQPWRVDVQAIISGSSRDIPLQDGDVIYIPESAF